MNYDASWAASGRGPHIVTPLREQVAVLTANKIDRHMIDMGHQP